MLVSAAVRHIADILEEVGIVTTVKHVSVFYQPLQRIDTCPGVPSTPPVVDSHD